MPTNLNRIQVLMEPDSNAKIRSLAKYRRRSRSNVCNELIAYALLQPKFRQMLKDAEVEGVKMAPSDDPRSRINQPMQIDIRPDGDPVAPKDDLELNFTDKQLERLAELMLEKVEELKR